MSAIQLLRVGEVDQQIVETLAKDLSATLSLPVSIAASRVVDASFAFLPERGQYHSSEILSAVPKPRDPTMRVVGICDLDLCIPILTFVFGEAETGGQRAIVSSRRLRQEFYGLPGDDVLLAQRLAKETIHEIGHLFSLHHCQNYECLMASSHSVEWIDLKTELCLVCRNQMSHETPPLAEAAERVL